MKNDQLNVGCVGAGTVFFRHADGWADCASAHLVALSDTNPEALREQSTKYGIGRTYADPAEMLACSDIDIVDICAPNGAHAELVIAALEAGKHVICQKPLAPTSDEIRRIIAARDRAGKLVMTAQQYRYGSVARDLKAQIDAGALGDIYHARCWYLRRAGLPVRPGLIYRRFSGGGVGIDLGVHVLDLTLWLMGNPQPVSVSGSTKSVLAKQPDAFGQRGAAIPADIDVEDFANGFVRFANDATLSIEVSWLLLHPNTDEKRIWLYGSRGGAVFPDATMQQFDAATNDVATSSIEATSPKIGEYEQAAYTDCFCAFAVAVRDGAASPIAPEQSLHVQSILEAIYASQRTGHEVRLSG